MSTTGIGSFIASAVILAATLSGFAPEIHAQSLGSYLRRYEIGFGYQRATSDVFDIYDGKRVPNRRLHSVAHAACFSLGLNVPLLTFGDQFGIGINPDLQFSVGIAPYDPDFPVLIQHLDQSPGVLRAALPTLLTLRYGTDATMLPATAAGGGFGIGYRPVVNVSLEHIYGEPVAMGELSVIVSDRLIKFRATVPLAAGHPDDHVDIRTLDISMFILPGR